MNVELQMAATMFIEVWNLPKSYMSKGLDKCILETWSSGKALSTHKLHRSVACSNVQSECLNKMCDQEGICPCEGRKFASACGVSLQNFFSSYVGCPASHQFEDSGLNTENWKLDT